MHYIAVFHPAEEKAGAYTVTFPDLPGCITQGDNFAEAFAMAQEALEGFLEVLRKDGDPIPEPSSFARVQALTEAAEEGEALAEGTLYQAVPVLPPEEAPVRVNISLSPRVLARIDRYAQSEGLTRSGFLATAARHYINQVAAVEVRNGSRACDGTK